MTKLYFLRHGQSMGNLERRFLGHTDLPLSDLGKKQAERVAEVLGGYGFDAIYSSDLLRARETAAPLAARLGIPVIPVPALREIDAGLWEGLSFPEICASYADSYHTFRADIGVARPDGGESTQEVADRVFAAVTELARRNPGKTLLLTSHATAICMFACRVLGLSPAACRSLRLPPNASLSSFDYDGGEFHMCQYGEDAYLGELRFLPPPTA